MHFALSSVECSEQNYFSRIKLSTLSPCSWVLCPLPSGLQPRANLWTEAQDQCHQQLGGVLGSARLLLKEKAEDFLNHTRLL